MTGPVRSRSVGTTPPGYDLDEPDQTNAVRLMGST